MGKIGVKYIYAKIVQYLLLYVVRQCFHTIDLINSIHFHVGSIVCPYGKLVFRSFISQVDCGAKVLDQLLRSFIVEPSFTSVLLILHRGA